MELFEGYFKIYGYPIAPIDRTGIIRFPVRTKSLFPIPNQTVTKKTYSEICLERAKELLKRADETGLRICVCWSGGIDSTAVLCAFFQVAPLAELKDKLVVMLTHASVKEYRDFYFKHIGGKLVLWNAVNLRNVLGSGNIIVNGEHNDQLFGSDIMLSAINKFGEESLHAPYDRKMFMQGLGYLKDAQFYVDLFERLAAGAPIELKTNFDRLWWINFAVKWQTVFMRPLSFSSRPLTKEWVSRCFAPFYGTEEFQRWSMCNLDRRMKSGWKSYKWPAKDFIYEFTKDAEYRDNKIKELSWKVLVNDFDAEPRFMSNFIDEDFRPHTRITQAELYEPSNDFIR